MTTVVHHNPPSMPSDSGFSHAVSVAAPQRTIYVGGQHAITPDGEIVGRDIAAQTVVALRNVETVLADAGARLDDVVALTVFAVSSQPVGAVFEATHEVWGDRGLSPTISVAVVAALANHAFLVEISAIAVT